jgi:hypothetical protein
MSALDAGACISRPARMLGLVAAAAMAGASPTIERSGRTTQAVAGSFVHLNMLLARQVGSVLPVSGSSSAPEAGVQGRCREA